MAHNPNELVWAEKPGFPRKQFTRQQLSAMGDDEGKDTFNGWAIVPEVQEPDEVKEAKKQAAAEAKEKAEKAKAEKTAKPSEPKKAKAEKTAPVVPLNPDQGDTGATKTEADNGQIADNQKSNAEIGAENTDLGGSAAAPSGQGN